MFADLNTIKIMILLGFFLMGRTPVSASCVMILLGHTKHYTIESVGLVQQLFYNSRTSPTDLNNKCIIP
jgi:hypothetical protein